MVPRNTSLSIGDDDLSVNLERRPFESETDLSPSILDIGNFPQRNINAPVSWNLDAARGHFATVRRKQIGVEFNGVWSRVVDQ
jgi:hypothetical protein